MLEMYISLLKGFFMYHIVLIAWLSLGTKTFRLG